MKYYFILVLSILVLSLSRNVDATNLQNDNNTHVRYGTKNGFILSEPYQFVDESEMLKPYSELKNKSSTTIKGGCIYNYQGNLLNTEDENIYALDHDGILYVSDTMGGVHHSYFIQSELESGKGISEKVACAGMIRVVNGKITKFSNASGHYHPIEDQLKLAVLFLNTKNVLDPNIYISVRIPDINGGGEQQIALNSILEAKPETILLPYSPAIEWTNEYINIRKESEKSMQYKLEQYQKEYPKLFLECPITNVISNFHAPTHKGKVDFGIVEIENKKWNAIMVNAWKDLPSIITQAPPSSFKWEPFHGTQMLEIMSDKKGIVTRHAAHAYYILHNPEPQKIFSLYLISNND